MLGVSNTTFSTFHASRLSVRLDAMMLIRQALFPTEQDDVVSIFREYVTSPTANLDFQEYEAEFAGLPGQYAAPTGRLLLACENDTVLGCAALRRVDESTCEMKRVYVRPAARGKGLGRRLVEAVLSEAKLAGYSRLCLDVLPEFTAAQELYESLGFVPAEPVSFNPVPGTKFLALAL
jgi:putative acetyltransferase